MRLTCVILILSQINFGCAIFSSNTLKNTLDRAKNYYKSKMAKDKKWHFLGTDPSEYPGTNVKHRTENQQKWAEYYECLKNQYENVGNYGSLIPETVIGFPGRSVIFDCKVCQSPREILKEGAIEWYWAPLGFENLQLVDYDEHILKTPDDKSLHIYNLREEHTGQYICKLGAAATTPYFLTVLNSKHKIIEVHTRRNPKPQQPQLVFHEQLILYTEWTDWSKCSTCNKVGKKYRLGYCIAKLNPNSTTPKTHISLDIFKIFANGIACHSHVMPGMFSNILNRNEEILIGYCKTFCPGETIFEVKDSKGNVLERANNSAGIYSMLQKIPPIEPSVERRLLYEKRNKFITLSCPGNLNSDEPIQWKIGDKKVVPELLALESKGRLFVSVMDNIVIKRTKVSDSNVYSCWQNKQLAGTIKLIIDKVEELQLNHHIMIFGIVMILATFAYVFVRAFFGRQYAAIKK